MFKAFLLYCNFNLIYAYYSATQVTHVPVQLVADPLLQSNPLQFMTQFIAEMKGEFLFMVFSYILFVLLCFALDHLKLNAYV